MGKPRGSGGQEGGGGGETLSENAAWLGGNVDRDEEAAGMHLGPGRLDELGLLQPEGGVEVLQIEVDAREPALVAERREPPRQIAAGGVGREYRPRYLPRKPVARVVRERGDDVELLRRLRNPAVLLDEELPVRLQPDPFRHDV